MVGAKGSFGTLNNNNLSMSFDYSNLSGGGGNTPYAAFGLSENSLWNLSAQEFLVIAVGGNQLNGSTLVHVVNDNTGADYIPLSGAITLGQLAGDTSGRLMKFKVRLCDPSVISRLRRFVSRHTGLDAPDNIAEPKRSFVPVINRDGLAGRISSAEVR